MTPQFPVISIYRNRDIDVLESESPLKYMSLHEYINNKAADSVYYDENGFKWTLSLHSAYKPTIATKLLARTFYSPVIVVHRTWTQVGSYPLTELIQRINHSIELDYDIITRYKGVDELKATVARCTTFKGMIMVVYDHVFKPAPKRMNKVV